MDNEQLTEQENDIDALILGAKQGDSDARRDLLEKFVFGADRGEVHPKLLHHVAEAFARHLKLGNYEPDAVGVSLDTALGVVPEKNSGGLKKLHDEPRIMALYILLTDHLNYAVGKAITEVSKETGADVRTVEKMRTDHIAAYNKCGAPTLMESMNKRALMERAKPIPKAIYEALRALE